MSGIEVMKVLQDTVVQKLVAANRVILRLEAKAESASGTDFVTAAGQCTKLFAKTLCCEMCTEIVRSVGFVLHAPMYTAITANRGS